MLRPRHLPSLFLLIPGLFQVGCTSTSPASAPVTSDTPVVSAPVVSAPVVSAPEVSAKDDTRSSSRMSPGIHWVRNSAEYRAILLQAYAVATERLTRRVSDRQAGTWAVALDADETVISNSQYQKELFRAGESYSRESWTAWTQRREATALPGAREFLEHARDLGGKIVIVTNRRLDACDDTRANFQALSLPFDVILCRGEDRSKEPRWDSVRKGTASSDLPPLEIVMWLGDNIEDFPDWSQKKRLSSDADFSDFGDKFFVIPNPMYGSWQSNPIH